MRKACLVISILFLFLSVFSQNQPTRLGVGSVAPKLNGVFKWIKGNPLTEFKKGKIYVVEFGATWCGPCVASIPSLTALASRYPQDVAVESFFVMEANTEPRDVLNPKYVTRVEEFVAARHGKIGYNVAVDGPDKPLVKAWIEAAGRSGIPQTFIIDREGKIAWIGSNPKMLDSIVQAVRTIGYRTQSQQNDQQKISVDSIQHDRPIFLSELTWYTGHEKANDNNPYIANLSWAKSEKWKKKQGDLTVRGENLRRLYFMAYSDTLWNAAIERSLSTGEFPDTLLHPEAKRSYGKYWYKPLLRLSDSSIFEADDYVTTMNRFNYHLVVPTELSSARQMRTRMQSDLKNYFGFNVHIEQRSMPCWYLKTSEEARKKLRTKTPGQKYRKSRDKNGDYITQNGTIQDLIFNLEIRYGYSAHGLLVEHPQLQPPFIDATEIKGEVDFKTDHEKIQRIFSNADKASTFEEYRQVLHEIGIELIKGRKMMNVIVIEEPDDQALKN